MKFIKFTFVLLFPITFFGLLIESFRFKYFFLKHFYLNLEFLTVIVIVVVFVIVSKSFSEVHGRTDKFIRLYLVLSKIGLVVISIAYLVLSFMDRFNYHNYSFSKFHIQPDLLLRPLILLLFFTVAYLIKARLNNLGKIRVLNLGRNFYEVSLTIGLTTLLIVFGINNLLTAVSNLTPSLISVFKTTGLNREDTYKYTMRSNYGHYFDYIEFVKNTVPTNASILLPPQQNPWQFEGNQRLDRYFLYPRILYSAHEKKIPDNYDYVIIAWGSDAFPPATGDTYGWPSYNMKAKQVYIYDINLNTYMIYEGDYDYSKYLKEGVFGIIKIK